jgi:hypothetical protein
MRLATILQKEWDTQRRSANSPTRIDMSVSQVARWIDDEGRLSIARDLARHLLAPRSGGVPVDARLFESGLIEPGADSEDARLHPWLLAVLAEASPVRVASEDALTELMGCTLVGFGWQVFLENLGRVHPWLLEEMRAAGFDATSEDCNLALYLLRTDQTPEDFVVGLLRPTDVRKLFPGTDLSRPRAAILREALAAWCVSGGGR